MLQYIKTQNETSCVRNCIVTMTETEWALAERTRTEGAVVLPQPSLRGGGEVVISGGVAQIKPVR